MFKVSDIKLSVKGVKRLLLFQTLSQFISYCVCVLLAILVVSTLGDIFFDAKMISKTSIFFAFIGGLPAAFFALPSYFEIHGTGRMQGYAAIEDRLISWGRERFPINQSETAYQARIQAKMPKLLRWESNVRMRAENDRVMVMGPYGTISGLRKYLLRTYNIVA